MTKHYADGTEPALNDIVRHIPDANGYTGPAYRVTSLTVAAPTPDGSAISTDNNLIQLVRDPLPPHGAVQAPTALFKPRRPMRRTTTRCHNA